MAYVPKEHWQHRAVRTLPNNLKWLVPRVLDLVTVWGRWLVDADELADEAGISDEDAAAFIDHASNCRRPWLHRYGEGGRFAQVDRFDRLSTKEFLRNRKLPESSGPPEPPAEVWAAAKCAPHCRSNREGEEMKGKPGHYPTPPEVPAPRTNESTAGNGGDCPKSRAKLQPQPQIQPQTQPQADACEAHQSSDKQEPPNPAQRLMDNEARRRQEMPKATPAKPEPVTADTQKAIDAACEAGHSDAIVALHQLADEIALRAEYGVGFRFKTEYRVPLIIAEQTQKLATYSFDDPEAVRQLAQINVGQSDKGGGKLIDGHRPAEHLINRGKSWRKRNPSINPDAEHVSHLATIMGAAWEAKRKKKQEQIDLHKQEMKERYAEKPRQPWEDPIYD